VHISGSREACELAKGRVMGRLDEWRAEGGGKTSGPVFQLPPGDVETEVIYVPSITSGFMIGSNGAAIHMMQQEANCRISIAASGDVEIDGAPKRPVTITGKPEDLERARELVAARVTLFMNTSVEGRAAGSLQRSEAEAEAEWNGGGGGGHGGSGASGGGAARDDGAGDERGGERGGHLLTVSIDNADAIGYIIGRGGTAVNSIESECGVRVRLMRDASPPEFVVTGMHAADCERAREALTARLDDFNAQQEERAGGGGGGGGGGARDDGSVFVEMPRASLGFIIGKGGTSISAIETECVVRMSVMRDHDPPGVQIVGPEAGMEKARLVLQDRLRDWEANGPPPPQAMRGGGRDGPRGGGGGGGDWYNQAGGGPGGHGGGGPGPGGPGGGPGRQTVLEVLIPDRLIRHVIGNRGAKIDAIEQETGARVKVDKERPLIGPDECKCVPRARPANPRNTICTIPPYPSESPAAAPDAERNAPCASFFARAPHRHPLRVTRYAQAGDHHGHPAGVRARAPPRGGGGVSRAGRAAARQARRRRRRRRGESPRRARAVRAERPRGATATSLIAAALARSRPLARRAPPPRSGEEAAPAAAARWAAMAAAAAAAGTTTTDRPGGAAAAAPAAAWARARWVRAAAWAWAWAAGWAATRRKPSSWR
jgi:transcription antitermination factor NusA-like protein